MEKKQLIKVKPWPSANKPIYAYTSMFYSLVSSPETGRVQCHDIASCRETINHFAYTNIEKPERHTNNPIDFEKLRLLMVLTIKDKDQLAKVKEKIFSGKALLNRFEENAGWDTSKITTVTHPHYKDAWLLTGPKEWMSQPQLLTIATLFMRIMSIHGPMEIDTFQQARDSLRNLYNTNIEIQNNTKNGCYTYYPDIARYLRYLDGMELLITHRKEIFGGLELANAWSCNNGSNFSISSGLLSFFDTKNPPKYNDHIGKVTEAFRAIEKNVATEGADWRVVDNNEETDVGYYDDDDDEDDYDEDDE